MTRYDLTVSRDSGSGEFLFQPHSGEADKFLRFEFDCIGDADLTMQDADLIIRRAKRRGLLVNDTMRT